MKRILLNSIALVCAAIILASCGGDDPLPAPMPAFEASTAFDVFEMAQPIDFINSTTNASSYTWDFGDGGTSTDINPEYTYAEPGDYTVTLTAITDDEQMDTATLNISVGQRFLTAFGVLSISFDNIDQNGNIEGPWDVGSGPDVIFVFGPDDDDTFEETIATFGSPVADITEPFAGFAFELNDPLPLEDKPYTLLLLDDDTDIEANAFETMIQAQGFNPIVNSNTQILAEDKIGRITISGGGFEIFLDFEID